MSIKYFIDDETTTAHMLNILLLKVNRITAAHRHGEKPSVKDLDILSNIQIEIEENLAIMSQRLDISCTTK